MVLLGALLVSCGKPEPASPPSGDTAEKDARRFAVKGVVQEVREEGKVLVIDHEEMPGYMRAMIMPFRVKDPAQAAGLEPGDEIEFTYVVQELASWIEGIKRTGNKGEIKTQSRLDTNPAAPLLGVGDELPDYEFLDEEGRGVKLSDFREGPVALTFIFTRCPVPEFCPATMRKFATVRDTLSRDPAAPAGWRLLTISFDSLNDSPPVMKSFRSAFSKETENWVMLSSYCCSIQELAANVGLKFGEVKGSYEHNLRTVVLDGAGRITQIFLDETWSPEALVAGIKAAAAEVKPVAGS